LAALIPEPADEVNYVAKPFTPSELAAKVREVMG